jgi:polysaccharide export outer membrane protein
MNLGVRTLAVTCVVAAVALGGRPGELSAQAAAGSAAALVDASAYRVGPEDVLEISVWREDALKKEVLVRPDGGISFPLVGEVQVAGKSVGEIREELTKRLDRFVPDPAVSVTVVKTGSQRIYVVGKVAKPGEFPLGRYVDVLQALSMAGGLTPFADAGNIRVMRREGERQVVLPFEYGAVVRGQKIEQNVLLRTGDVVVVP